MTLSPDSAAKQRSSSAKLEALLAKLAVRKLELDKQAAEAGVVESDAESDSEQVKQTDVQLRTTAPSSSSRVSSKTPAKRTNMTKSIYGSKQYWDDRYTQPDTTIGANKKKSQTNNEWYVGWEVLKGYFLDYTTRSHRVVLLGCGTSTLGEDMASDGFSRITAVDYSEPSITLMQKAQQNRMAQFERKKQRGEFDDVPLDAPPVPTNFEVDYRVMDVTQMTLTNASFDCVIDKATLDTMCQLDEESDSEEEENEVSTKSATYTQKNKTKSTHVSKMLRESCRVLRPGGVYVCVTYGEPVDRMDHFLELELEWDLLAHRVLLKNKAKYHLYAFRKKGGEDGKKDSTQIDPTAIVDMTSLDVIRVGNSTAAIPVFKDPFHGSSLDFRERRY